MPADLDLPPERLARLLGALGAHAERIPLGTPEAARRRGERRRQRFAVTAAALIVLLVAGTAGAIRLTRESAPPPVQPSPRPTVTFMPLQTAGSVPMEQAESESSFYDSSILDGVAYVLSGGRDLPLLVGALDLATGTQPFAPVDFGRWASVSGLVTSHHGVLVWGLRPVDASTAAIHEGDPMTTVVAVLNPWTGAARWQRTFGDGQVIVVNDVIVVYEPGSMRLSALFWGTGEVLWSRAVDASRGLLPIKPEVQTLPSRFGEWGPKPSDRRVLAAGGGGQIEIIDVRNRDSLALFSVGAAESIVPIGQTIYTAAGREVWAYPLDGSGGTRIRVGTGAESFRVNPCGEGLVCLFSDLTFSVIALDASTYEERLEQRQTLAISVVGDRLLTPEGHLWDLESRELAGADPDLPQQVGAVWWLTPGSLLRLSVPFSSPTHWPTVEGVSTEDGSRLDLGEIPALNLGAGCAADLHYLVCPTTDGFHAWQFATD